MLIIAWNASLDICLGQEIIQKIIVLLIQNTIIFLITTNTKV